MAEYINAADSFALSSVWKCGIKTTDTMSTYVITESPSEASKKITFAVKLPNDAVISRMWVTAVLGSPNSGAAYIRLNGENFRSGEVDVTGITAESTEFSATITFKANGAVYQDEKQHSGSLSVASPTLHIAYTAISEGGEDTDVPGTSTPSGALTGGDKPGRLPRLLGTDMREVVRLEPIRVSLDMALKPLSSAVVTIPWGETEVKVRDYMELFSPDGSAGIFRVSEVENTYGVQQKIYCEEALATLSDSIAVGVQPMSGTFREVIASILEGQSVKQWVLGDVDLPDDYETVYEYSYDTLYNAIMDLTEMLPEGYAWERDTSVYPFVLHLRKLPDDDRCEARLSRNLESVAVSIDTSKLCTRVYPFGDGEGTDRIDLSTLADVNALFLDADTVGTWGIVAKSFVEEDISDSLTLKSVAEQYLEKYKDPVVSVTLDALALYAATGETIDRFRLGRMCLLPLKAYGVTMQERVIAVSYPDVYGRPQKATVTLANKVNTVSDELGAMMREATHSKLIGGKVKTKDFSTGMEDITSDPDDSLTCYFDITGYGNVLSAKMVYNLRPDKGEQVKANIHIDGQEVTADTNPGVAFDIMPYLKKDDSGIPVMGQHNVNIYARGDDFYYGSIKVSLKTVEKE